MINLTGELKMAMRAGDKPRKAVIVSVKGEVANYKIAKKKDEINETEMFDLMKKVRKVLLETIEWKIEAKQDADSETAQLQILNSWLPNKIGDDYLNEMIDEAISKLKDPSIKQMGMVMSMVKTQVAEANLDVEGKRLSSMVKQSLLK